MSLHLPPRLCFCLVAFLLVGVLSMGNPFRCCHVPARAAELPSAQTVDPVAVPGTAPLTGTASLAGTAPANGTMVALQVNAPVAEPCPFPELANAVVSVHRDAQGESIWVLADGRQVRRSHTGASFEVLQPVADPRGREHDQAAITR